MIISSEKQYEKEDKNKNWMRREYVYASFQPMLQLHQDADRDRVQTDMKNGILLIKVAIRSISGKNKKQIAIQ